MKHLFPGLHSVSVICAGVGWRTRHDEGRVLADILWSRCLQRARAGVFLVGVGSAVRCIAGSSSNGESGCRIAAGAFSFA
jgi:hypothetical protein